MALHSLAKTTKFKKRKTSSPPFAYCAFFVVKNLLPRNRAFNLAVRLGHWVGMAAFGGIREKLMNALKARK